MGVEGRLKWGASMGPGGRRGDRGMHGKMNFRCGLGGTGLTPCRRCEIPLLITATGRNLPLRAHKQDGARLDGAAIQFPLWGVMLDMVGANGDHCVRLSDTVIFSLP